MLRNGLQWGERAFKVTQIAALLMLYKHSFQRAFRDTLEVCWCIKLRETGLELHCLHLVGHTQLKLKHAARRSLFRERSGVESEMCILEEIKKRADTVCASAKFNWKGRLGVQLLVLQMHMVVIDWLLSATTVVNLAAWWLMTDAQLFQMNFHILGRNLITGGKFNGTLHSSSF